MNYAKSRCVLAGMAVAATAIAGCAALVNGSDENLEGAASALTAAPSYIVPVAERISIKSLLTVGESVNDKADGTPYRLVGLGDGLGAFDNKDGTFTLLMNHELRDSQGIARAHGGKGAFVSKWTIAKGSHEVLHGEDLIQSVRTFDAMAGAWITPAAPVNFARFCSADLADPDAFSKGRSGTSARIFMNGEENGSEGRAFAHIVTGPEAGVSYELPHLGKMSFENVVANPGTGTKTVVALTDDTGGGQVYLYRGSKQRSGNTIERAGLAAGELFGIKVDGVVTESDATLLNDRHPFSAVALGDVSKSTGATIDANSVAQGVTGFNRPEDAAWNPQNPNELFFVSTASMTNKSRLWRLTFVRATEPELGGYAEILVDGGDVRMLDNLTVSRDGKYVLLQEDPGGNDHLAKVWRYTLRSKKLEILAQHNPDLFTPGAAAFLTRDEESSGVIDVSEILGRGWYVGVDQAHLASTDVELAEGGQLFLLQAR